MHGHSLLKRHLLKKIELRPLISGFDFALLEVRNLCVASRLLAATIYVNDVYIICVIYFSQKQRNLWP